MIRFAAAHPPRRPPNAPDIRPLRQPLQQSDSQNRRKRHFFSSLLESVLKIGKQDSAADLPLRFSSTRN